MRIKRQRKQRAISSPATPKRKNRGMNYLFAFQRRLCNDVDRNMLFLYSRNMLCLEKTASRPNLEEYKYKINIGVKVIVFRILFCKKTSQHTLKCETLFRHYRFTRPYFLALKLSKFSSSSEKREASEIDDEDSVCMK